MTTQRLTVRYSGHVQGVGFRISVDQIASELSVVGEVCNLYCGDVLLIAEGTAEELMELRDRVASERARFIVTANQVWADVSKPGFEAFRIVSDRAG